MSDLLKLLLAIVLVALNGFFVAAEFAMIRVRRTRVEELADQGVPVAKIVLNILGRLDIFLAATQLGITMANLGLGWIGEPVMAEVLAPIFRLAHLPAHITVTISVVVGFAIITVVEVVFGELLPKWSVIQSTDKAARFVAYPMQLFVQLFYAPILFLKWFASVFARMIGINPAAVGMIESAHSEDEIIAIVEQAEQSGTIGESEAEIVDNVFEFAHTQVTEVMIPRVDMVCLHTEWSLARNMEVATDSGYTRFPLCVDDSDHVIGMVHIKDLINLAAEAEAGSQADIRSVMREIPAVPPTKRIGDLLRQMQRIRSHMAIVLDEYGGTHGLVSLEDILEELVGEIQDEFDEPPPVERLDETRIAVAGAEPIDTIADELGIAFDDAEDYQTVGGYARHVLGLAPQVGASARLDGYVVTVSEAQRQRINRLLFEKQPEPVGGDAEPSVD